MQEEARFWVKKSVRLVLCVRHAAGPRERRTAAPGSQSTFSMRSLQALRIIWLWRSPMNACAPVASRTIVRHPAHNFGHPEMGGVPYRRLSLSDVGSRLERTRWMPRRQHRNARLIGHLRRLWRRAQTQQPGQVDIVHVRSHTGVPGNEIADWLADCGAKGGSRASGDARSSVSLQRAERWIREWLQQQQKRPGGATT